MSYYNNSVRPDPPSYDEVVNDDNFYKDYEYETNQYMQDNSSHISSSYLPNNVPINTYIPDISIYAAGNSHEYSRLPLVESIPPPPIDPNMVISGSHCSKCSEFFIRCDKDINTEKYIKCEKCIKDSRCCSKFCIIM